VTSQFSVSRHRSNSPFSPSVLQPGLARVFLSFCHSPVARKSYKDNVKNSEPPSLTIDFAPTPWTGEVGMSACPGKKQSDLSVDNPLAADIALILAHGIKTVVSLLDTIELQRLGAKNLSHHLGLHGIAWHQLPVVDFGVPSAAVTAQWRRLIPQLTNTLQTSNILVHCAHGKGRTGTLVATMYKTWGWSSEAAIARVRQYRPGAIETHKQESYVEAFTPLSLVPSA
jgi:protein-tyrosine phosphatase